MYEKFFKTAVFVASLAMTTATGFGSAQAFELHGSSTVGKNLVAPNLAGIESASGLKLNMVMNGSGNGMKDLLSGKADMAMISAPIEAEAAIANAKAPGSLDITGLKVHPVGAATINIVVHPSNTAALTQDNIRGIFTGEITDWKDVGGTAGPILVVVEAPGQGTRAVVESVFLQGKPIVANARVMQVLTQLTQVTGQAPTAISYGNSSSITDAVKVVSGIEVAQPLALVTKGDPTPEQQKLIDSIAAAGKNKK